MLNFELAQLRLTTKTDSNRIQSIIHVKTYYYHNA